MHQRRGHEHETTMIEGRAAEMQTDLLTRVAQVHDELHIRSGKGGTRDRQRTALAVADAYLDTIGEHARRDDGGVMHALDLQRIHQTPMLEWQVFEALAGLGLVCDPLPEEERLRNR